MVWTSSGADELAAALRRACFQLDVSCYSVAIQHNNAQPHRWLWLTSEAQSFA
jgi:hypothetical protein